VAQSICDFDPQPQEGSKMTRLCLLFCLITACGVHTKPSSTSNRPERFSQERRVVEFVISNGTGMQPWNQESQTLVVFQGQILRLRNEDSVVHTLHTYGKPCEHGTDIQPGGSFECVLTDTYDSRVDGPLRDHAYNDASFWLIVLPDPAKVLASNCLSCHSSTRKTGGLDLQTSPPVSPTSDLLQSLKQRLAPDASDEFRMPPDVPALNASDAESLIEWGKQGFFELKQTNETNPPPPDIQPLPDRHHGIDELVDYARKSQIGSVEGFLKILPNELHDNYVLMKQTGSRHLASLEFPRGILFTKNARLLISFSSHPQDPLRETVEMAEALPNGTWKFRELSFASGKPELNPSDVVCQSCHTATPRPIWGSYPDWPGAFGNVGPIDAPDEVAVMSELATRPETKDRYGSLHFVNNGSYYLLPNRAYSYPNTVFNIELGWMASYKIFQRMEQDPKATQLYAGWLLKEECNSSAGSYGSITGGDLDLRTSTLNVDMAGLYWNTGPNYMPDLVGYWALIRLMKDNQLLSGIFAPLQDTMNLMLKDVAGVETYDRKLINLSDLRPSQYLYPEVLGPQGDPRRTAFCEELSRLASSY
jgi:hypothetical protein